MSKISRWIASIGAVILVLALITVVGAWRLGLLPLFFPPPAPIGTAQNTTTETGLPPAGTYIQQQQPSKTGAETDVDNTGKQQTSLSAHGLTTMNNSGSATGLPEDSAQLTKDQLRQQIDDYYTARLQSLGESYEGKLNGLVNEAFSEYQSDKKQGNDISVATLAFKYISEGSALEKQCDAQFYPLLDEYEADLRKNNLPLDTAIKAKQEYESSKVNRKKELLSAAAKMI
jgi:hypothetical protein